MDRSRSFPPPGCRAIVFDLDGTLADTGSDITAALNLTLSELHLPPHSEDIVRGMVGNGLAKLLDRALARHDSIIEEEKQDAALERLLSHYAANPCERSTLYPGVQETLSALHNAGLACGVFTNKHEPIGFDVLEGLGIAALVKTLCGANDRFP